MTPERRAEVVAVCRHVAYCVERPPLNGDHLATGLREAARELEIKPSESSMVQRIGALERCLRNIRTKAHLVANPWAGDRIDPRQSCASIIGMIDRTLDGPPDPERDRETRAEVERP